MKCNECGAELELGSMLTKGCDGCLRNYITMRQTHIERGGIATAVAVWARKRARELGIWILCPGGTRTVHNTFKR